MGTRCNDFYTFDIEDRNSYVGKTVLFKLPYDVLKTIFDEEKNIKRWLQDKNAKIVKDYYSKIDFNEMFRGV